MKRGTQIQEGQFFVEMEEACPVCRTTENTQKDVITHIMSNAGIFRYRICGQCGTEWSALYKPPRIQVKRNGKWRDVPSALSRIRSGTETGRFSSKSED